MFRKSGYIVQVGKIPLNKLTPVMVMTGVMVGREVS